MAEKLDAKFSGVIFKIKDGTIVPDDEYVIFLVKDTAFFNTLPTYRAECVKLGADREQISAVDRMVKRAGIWRRDRLGRDPMARHAAIALALTRRNRRKFK